LARLDSLRFEGRARRRYRQDNAPAPAVQKLDRISRAGDEDLRRLLVIGATAVIRAAKPGRTAPWLLALLARKSKKLAAVALANKMARIVWAMMVSGETYRPPAQA
jgi:transposase